MAAKGKWSRLGSAITHLDHVWKDMQTHLKPVDSEHLVALKIAAAKLYEILHNKDKACKDYMNKYSKSVPLLFDVAKFSSSVDQQITINIVDSLSHLVSNGKGLNILLGAGIMRLITECLVNATIFFLLPNHYQTEDLFISLYTLLIKLASKDKRFATISRIAGGVECSVGILKHYSSHNKISGLVLQVMKLYAASAVNCTIMIKGGGVTLLMKMIPLCGQKKLQLLKHLLELMASLCKAKTGAKKAVNQGVLPLMLSMYQESHRYDHRNRNPSIRKSFLNVIKACVAFEFGCKAFLTANGYRTLYFLGLEALDHQEMEGVLRIMIFILRKCTKNNKLPIDRQASTHFFCLASASLKISDEIDGKSNETEEENSEGDSIDEVDAESDVSVERNGMGSESEMAMRTSVDNNINSGNKDFDYYKSFLGELSFFQRDVQGFRTDYNGRVGCEGDGPYEEDTNEDRGVYIHIPTASLDEINGTNYSDADFESDSNFIKDSIAQIADDEANITLLAETSLMSDGFHTFSLQSDDSGDESEELVVAYTPDFFQAEMRSALMGSSSFKNDRYGEKKKLTDLSFRPDIYRRHSDKCYSSFRSPGCSAMKDFAENSRVNVDANVINGNRDVKGLYPFVQIPIPTVLGHTHRSPQRLYEKKSNLQRVMMFQEFSRFIFPEQLMSRVVYDLDRLIMNSLPNEGELTTNMKPVSQAKPRVIKKSQSVPKISTGKRRSCTSVLSSSLKEESELTHLTFESRFECGNLRKAIQIRQYEYDLILNPDVNNNNHHQWFYFQVEKMEAGALYRFNIINCEKANSQFNFGMQPLLYSLRKAMDGSPHWERVGSDICYYKNIFFRGGKSSGKYYHTATFTIKFPYANDTCYLSYHYPYSLTMLNVHLHKMEASLAPTVHYTKQLLCKTLGGNDVYVLTITDANSIDEAEVDHRPYVVLTARVHPGESNSSWIMQGILDFIVSCDENARELRSLFIFKIIPMLNPDGVVNGCHRCSLSGQDLNRQWKNPDEKLHPSIYHVKSLLELMVSIKKKPLVFVDLHGHSRKKNVFLYGCEPGKWKSLSGEDSATQLNSNDSDSATCLDNNIYAGSEAVKMLPRIMSRIAPCFSLQSCNFGMDKSKESTARIVGFKELGITHCFTLESTYSGMDQGLYKGNQIGTRELEEMGWHFCLSLLKFAQSPNISPYDEPDIT